MFSYISSLTPQIGGWSKKGCEIILTNMTKFQSFSTSKTLYIMAYILKCKTVIRCKQSYWKNGAYFNKILLDINIINRYKLKSYINEIVDG